MPRKPILHAGPKAAPPRPWESFLKTVDGLLKEPVGLHCIGGFAMTMQYGLSRETDDIDVLPASPSERLDELQRLAGEGSDLHRRFKVYLQVVAISCYPEDYESRLIRMWPDLKLERLRLYSLEAHDLALTKLERNAEVDRQDVESLAKAGYLDPQTLRDRYFNELRPNLVSGVDRHDLTLKLWTEMCWP